MSKGPLLLWLVMQFRWLYLVPAASEDTVTSFLGQSVTLPCLYLSWSQSSNSMCWGKGHCPNSKCKQALVHTDGSSVLSRASAKYRLRGNIQRGDVSLTISNTNEEDSGVYCCRIEVPGWFNDVKKHIRLELSRAPTTRKTTTRKTTTRKTTTRKTTTSHPATTPHMVTTTAVLPTTAVTTPDLTTGTPLQATATSVFTTATTCPLTTLTSLPEVATRLPTTRPSTEGPVLTTESVTFHGSSASWRSTGATSADTASATAKGSETWALTSTPQVKWGVSDPGETGELVTSLHPASETTVPMQSKSKENDKTNLVVIIASSLGFVLLALVATFLLRGKVTETICLQKHKRLDKLGENKTVLNDMHRGQDDEDGLFTL